MITFGAGQGLAHASVLDGAWGQDGRCPIGHIVPIVPTQMPPEGGMLRGEQVQQVKELHPVGRVSLSALSPMRVTPGSRDHSPRGPGIICAIHVGTLWGF